MMLYQAAGVDISDLKKMDPSIHGIDERAMGKVKVSEVAREAVLNKVWCSVKLCCSGVWVAVAGGWSQGEG